MYFIVHAAFVRIELMMMIIIHYTKPAHRITVQTHEHHITKCNREY